MSIYIYNCNTDAAREHGLSRIISKAREAKAAGARALLLNRLHQLTPDYGLAWNSITEASELHTLKSLGMTLGVYLAPIGESWGAKTTGPPYGHNEALWRAVVDPLIVTGFSWFCIDASQRHREAWAIDLALRERATRRIEVTLEAFGMIDSDWQGVSRIGTVRKLHPDYRRCRRGNIGYVMVARKDEKSLAETQGMSVPGFCAMLKERGWLVVTNDLDAIREATR